MDITKRPKAASIDTTQIKAPKRDETFTLYKFITDHDQYPRRVSYLKDLSTRRGPWAEYHRFVVANLSGDFETLSKENRAYAEKIKKDLISQFDADMK